MMPPRLTQPAILPCPKTPLVPQVPIYFVSLPGQILGGFAVLRLLERWLPTAPARS